MNNICIYNKFLYALLFVSAVIILGCLFYTMTEFAFLFSTYFWIFDPLFIHKSSDAQGALGFLFLPLYQIIFTFFCVGISHVVDFVKK